MNKQRSWGVILQYAQMALNIVIHLIYTPIMIKLLGDNEYGLYNLVSSIIGYLSLLSLGFGAAYIRFYSRYKAQEDEESIKKLNALYLVVYSIMGVVSLIAGLIIAFNCGVFFNDTYTAGDMYIAKVLMIFLSINLAISFPASVFTSYITSQEKFIFLKLLNIINTVLSPCLCIAVLFLGYGSIGMVIATTALLLITTSVNIVYCLGKLKMRFKFGKPEKGLFKEIFVFSLFIAINQIIDQINWQTDKIILGKILNGTAVAIYAVGSTINNMFVNFSTAMSSVFVPKVHRIIGENKPDTDEQLTNLFIKVGRIQFFVIMLILTGFIFFGQYFVKIWAGAEYGLSYYVALLLICPVALPLIQNLGIEIQRAKNKHQFRSIVYLIMAIVNVGISIWFCKLWGVIGVALGTTISLVVCNIIIINVYYHLAIKIDMIKFWLNILKIIPSLIIPAACGVCIMLLVTYANIWQFLGFIILYTIIYCASVYLLGLNKQEKSYIAIPIKYIINLFRKNKNGNNN